MKHGPYKGWRDMDVQLCEDCDYPVDSFPCKIRCHLHINTGDAKAAND